MRILIPVVAMVFALGVVDAGAHDGVSNDGSTRNRVVIDFGDLNLNNEQDAKLMLQRIELAAKKACGGHHTFSSYTGAVDGTFDDCRDAAIQRAVLQLNAPVVNRIYQDAKERHRQAEWSWAHADRNPRAPHGRVAGQDRKLAVEPLRAAAGFDVPD